MNWIKLFCIILISSSCNSNYPNLRVSKLENMTEVKKGKGKNPKVTFKKDFFILEELPINEKALKKIMKDVANQNLDTEIERQKFVFIVDGTLESYKSNQNSGVDPAHIIGSVLFEKQGNSTEMYISKNFFNLGGEK
jgi:hypothetical protein